MRDDPLDADETLVEAFWSVAHLLRKASHTALAPLGLTPGHARALGTLARHGRMRLNALSEHLRIAARSTTEVVDALEADGLVIREPDPTDRRATLVTLTPEGVEVAHELKRARAVEAESLFGRLSSDQRAELRQLLDVLRAP
ncbi:MarR family transcriptional regulator [Isoptericola sp. b441]|uniref:MarR family transcriptional regulator n=1 Tax=Actinotalea lenta TaxID=3064654 RepID=A0ABT9D9R3_9CELL|nr:MULTISPECIES: MarR family transcriptional regulator [unclassified Isoptericola]MDO8106046.1 MarR family transcriptional regulator [Isoptericola sp. b441]MDO8122235.1 MarR family transcriptional regulator [Isoptericola sp. b490]